MEQRNRTAGDNPPAQQKLLKTAIIAVIAALGVAGALSAGVKLGIIPASWFAACMPCRPRNPCTAAYPGNPCAAANPCGAENPCNPLGATNPCAAENPCNPCAAGNPCGAWNPCNPCATGNPCAAQ